MDQNSEKKARLEMLIDTAFKIKFIQNVHLLAID